MAKAKNEKLSLEEMLELALVKDEDRPYEVPGNWVWTKIEFISDLKSGTTIPATEELPYGKIAYVKVADMNLQENSYSITTSSRFANNYNSSTVIPMNSVIFPKRGGAILTNKKRLVKEKEILVDLNIMAIIPNKKIPVSYMYDWFLTIDLSELNNGSNVPQINNKDIYPLKFPLPPIVEQQRIVAIIESLFEKLDTAKELAQNALDSFENRKAAILHKAFIGELTAKWREENGGSLDEWEKNDLGTMLKPMSSKKPNLDDEYFYYIDIDAINNRTQMVEKPKKILVSEAPSRASRGLESNDILFSLVRPYLKNIAIISDELSKCIASTGFYVSRCKETIYPYFLYHLLCSNDTINYYTSLMKGDNSPSIRTEDFKSLQVNLPPIEEQKEIIRILDNLLDNEQRAKDLCDVIEKIDLMKKAILARAFRGELGTNDPEDESAVELLKEVLREKI